MSPPIYAEKTLVAAVADDGPPTLTYARTWRDDLAAYAVALDAAGSGCVAANAAHGRTMRSRSPGRHAPRQGNLRARPSASSLSAAAVTDMPAGGDRLGPFITAIAERARLVGEHAQINGPDDPPAGSDAADGASTDTPER